MQHGNNNNEVNEDDMTTGAEAINNDDKVLNKFLQHKEPAIAAFPRWPSRLWWPKMIKMIDGPIVTLRGKSIPSQHPIPVGAPKSPVWEPTSPRGQRLWKVLLK